ncbi:MAG: hypothetical protein KDA59_25070 [Planctomycetales bacterium]|nr:hypothetical protein [Planctomycetales bacterium]
MPRRPSANQYVLDFSSRHNERWAMLRRLNLEPSSANSRLRYLLEHLHGVAKREANDAEVYRDANLIDALGRRLSLKPTTLYSTIADGEQRGLLIVYRDRRGITGLAIGWDGVELLLTDEPLSKYGNALQMLETDSNICSNDSKSWNTPYCPNESIGPVPVPAREPTSLDLKEIPELADLIDERVQRLPGGRLFNHVFAPLQRSHIDSGPQMLNWFAHQLGALRPATGDSMAELVLVLAAARFVVDGRSKTDNPVGRFVKIVTSRSWSLVLGHVSAARAELDRMRSDGTWDRVFAAAAPPTHPAL